MTSSFSLLSLFGFALAFSAFATDPRGLVDSTGGKNELLLSGVSHGLPGIDLDTQNVERMASHAAYKFHPNHADEAQGTSSNVAAELTRLSEAVGNDGTLFFYFSGHGSPGSLYMQDGSMSISKIRKALETGRAKLGPMQRLVMMFDSCYSGSLLDPVRDVLPLGQIFRPEIASELFADEAFRQLTPSRANDDGDVGEEPPIEYWKKLFVFASSRADETSLAGETGSVFTVALGKAYDEVIESNATLGDWVKKTQEYTVGHHPVARFAPATLEAEVMKP